MMVGYCFTVTAVPVPNHPVWAQFELNYTDRDIDEARNLDAMALQYYKDAVKADQAFQALDDFLKAPYLESVTEQSVLYKSERRGENFEHIANGQDGSKEHSEVNSASISESINIREVSRASFDADG
ncbi:MAG: hypothetical protein M1817_004980 [Caeruleum heppii]|nr:MAG: hypothetical protein M1817_004980 [Caeruleum heppii]